MNIEDKIGLIDLDGTAADYDTEMWRQMNLIRAPGEPEIEQRPTFDEDVPTYFTARRKMIQRQPGFWRNLKPLPLGFEVIADMREIGFALHVLTKGPKTTPNAWSEKLEWCTEHLPDATVTISGDKSLVYGRVLFDDFPPYIEPWLARRPRGQVVCLAHPWNAEYAEGGGKQHARVFRYDGSNREGLRKVLRRAFERGDREPL